MTAEQQICDLHRVEAAHKQLLMTHTKVNALDCFRMALPLISAFSRVLEFAGNHSPFQNNIAKLCVDLVPQTRVAEMVSL